MTIAAEVLGVGDVITITNKDSPFPRGYEWTVCDVRPDGAVKLRPKNNPFDDAAGEYWIVPDGVTV
jgi:hypothetical protein